MEARTIADVFEFLFAGKRIQRACWDWFWCYAGGDLIELHPKDGTYKPVEFGVEDIMARDWLVLVG